MYPEIDGAIKKMGSAEKELLFCDTFIHDIMAVKKSYKKCRFVTFICCLRIVIVPAHASLVSPLFCLYKYDVFALFLSIIF